jgi:hypothetical protein
MIVSLGYLADVTNSGRLAWACSALLMQRMPLKYWVATGDRDM